MNSLILPVCVLLCAILVSEAFGMLSSKCKVPDCKFRVSMVHNGQHQTRNDVWQAHSRTWQPRRPWMPRNIVLSPSHTTAARVGPLHSYKSVDIQSSDVQITDSLKSKVNEKIGKVLSKLSAGVVTSSHVTLKLDSHRDSTKNTHESGHVCEAFVTFKGGDVVKSSEHTTTDMYQSIDLASHSLAQALKKYRSKLKGTRNSRPKIGGSVAEDEVDEDEALFSFDESELLSAVDAQFLPNR